MADLFNYFNDYLDSIMAFDHVRAEQINVSFIKFNKIGGFR